MASQQEEMQSETNGQLAVALDDDLPVIHIKPTRSLLSLGLGVLWEYRDPLYYLTSRDIKVHYKQTIVAWPGKYRRLSKEYEALPGASKIFNYVAFIHLLARRLTRLCNKALS
jgi:hypothetical protein